MVYSTRKIDNQFVTEEKIEVGEIPCLRFFPNNFKDKLPTIIYYHGWSSNKEFQRFKANIMAAYGYQVIVPDSIHHGERKPVNHEEEGSLEKYLLKTIVTSIKEAPLLIDYTKGLESTDKDRIGIMGTSMGGFISSGIFVQEQIFKTLVVLNGASAWNKLEAFDQKEHSDQYWNYRNELIKYNPTDHLELLNDRPVLLLHGDSDTSVPIEAQRYFYKKAVKYYDNKNRIELVEVPRMDHYISTGMLENAIAFNEDYLKQ
ncbi:MAG TPA: prolyl oligopeptidase family serine peptidase [Halanaerobiales bacterium]|nr:prolyl oligopeptidase family serine peptidase [Halanaerobiales bacterium]